MVYVIQALRVIPPCGLRGWRARSSALRRLSQALRYAPFVRGVHWIGHGGVLRIFVENLIDTIEAKPCGSLESV